MFDIAAERHVRQSTEHISELMYRNLLRALDSRGLRSSRTRDRSGGRGQACRVHTGMRGQVWRVAHGEEVCAEVQPRKRDSSRDGSCHVPVSRFLGSVRSGPQCGAHCRWLHKARIRAHGQASTWKGVAFVIDEVGQLLPEVRIRGSASGGGEVGRRAGIGLRLSPLPCGW